MSHNCPCQRLNFGSRINILVLIFKKKKKKVQLEKQHPLKELWTENEWLLHCMSTEREKELYQPEKWTSLMCICISDIRSERVSNSMHRCPSKGHLVEDCYNNSWTVYQGSSETPQH